MNRGIYEIASAAVATQMKLDVVAQNLANAKTIGYKSADVAFSSQLLQNFPLATPSPDPITDALTPEVVDAQQVVDWTTGPITTTGNPLDVAIEGEGFFVVNTPLGERYTRQGAFRLDREGYLTTFDGNRVQGSRGDIRVGEGRVSIAQDGSVAVDNKVQDQLKLVVFGNAATLVQTGGGMFSGSNPTPLDPAEKRLVTGSLEEANVNAVSGLVALVDVTRAYESYMRAIHRLDEVAKKAIDEVGRVG
jgi:flagellar basal-body rod protein FlgG